MALINEFRALRGHFAAVETDDDRGVNETRASACEIVAWRFVTHLSKNESIDYLLNELPPIVQDPVRQDDTEAGLQTSTGGPSTVNDDSNERTPLMVQPSGRLQTPKTSRRSGHYFSESDDESDNGPQERHADFASSFGSLNALEIAAVAGAKKFLSQRVVQRIIDSIWKGEIIFWESLSLHSEKKARVYNKARTDPYSRLRVPRYLKAFEVIFFASFLALYYLVLVQKSFHSIMPAEILLYIWIGSFAYNECETIMDHLMGIADLTCSCGISGCRPGLLCG